jgi:hypothetical protein
MPRGAVMSAVCAVLNSLDNLVQADPLWAGMQRQRFTLKCAAAAAALIGRPKDEAQFCDFLASLRGLR